MSEDNLDSLINQLKTTNSISNEPDKDQGHMTPEELEAFVIKSSSELIHQSLNVMSDVKDYISASGDPDSISALSDLINASSKAISNLDKIVVQNKRSETTMAAKTLDAQAKYAIEEKKNENALIASREEVFKKLMTDAVVIDTDNETLSSSED